ncbi:MAG: glycosyltransferase [Gammaproteobacteria bacterium]|nr:glycosyltransferase [Gammaproteobacteria bacterium]
MKEDDVNARGFEGATARPFLRSAPGSPSVWRKGAHRIWRLLPPGGRRRLLLEVTQRIAPRPTSDARAAEPVIIVGSLTSPSGPGEAARLSHHALKGAGLDVYGIDVTDLLNHGRTFAADFFRDGRRCFGPGTILLHVNAPFVPLILAALGRRLIDSKRIVAFWAWELSALPDEWLVGMSFVHEIWVPSRFTAAAVETRAAVPVRVMPHPVSPFVGDGAEPADRGGEEPFTVLTMLNMASGFARKNPVAAIRAFRCAFGDEPETRMIVKVLNAGVYPAGLDAMRATIDGARNVTLVDEFFDSAATQALVAGCDVLLSTHRSEGFGLVLAEAMRAGRVVVATGWSGNTDFMTAQNSCPLEYRLVPVQDPQGNFDMPDQQWAEVDIEHAARCLARLREDPAMRRRLGDRARRDAARLFAPARFAAQACEHLGLTPGGAVLKSAD